MKFCTLAAALTLAISPAIAAPSGVTLTRGGLLSISRSTGTFTPNFARLGRKSVIFSNLGVKYPRGVYDCCEGVTVSAFGSSLRSQSWIAASFTPPVSAAATEIDAGIGNIAGAAGVVVAVFADKDGLPGAPLWSSDQTLSMTFGGCCQLLAAKIGGGIPLTAGTPYWIGMETAKNTEDTWDAWNLNTTDQVAARPAAVNDGTGWRLLGPSLPAPAFAVYGG